MNRFWSTPQAALNKEKGERARIVTSLRNTITGLREASSVEGRLKSDLMQVQEQLAAANAALVSQGLILTHRTQLPESLVHTGELHRCCSSAEKWLCCHDLLHVSEQAGGCHHRKSASCLCVAASTSS